MKTLNVILDYILTEDNIADDIHHQNVWKAIEEPIFTNDDVDFSREEV